MTTKTLSVSAKRARLYSFENELEVHLRNFARMGYIWKTIREERLWELEYKSFHEYCVNRWQVKGSTVVDSIAAYEVAENIETQGVPSPNSKGQAKELSKLPAEKQAEAFSQVIKSSGGNPTLTEVKKVVESYTSRNTSKRDAMTWHRQVSLTPELWRWVDSRANSSNISFSAVIRDALEEMKKREK